MNAWVIVGGIALCCLIVGVILAYLETKRQAWIEDEIGRIQYRFGDDGRWDRMCKFMSASMACSNPEEEATVLRAKKQVDADIQKEGEALGVIDSRGFLYDWYHPCWGVLREKLQKVPRKERKPHTWNRVFLAKIHIVDDYGPEQDAHDVSVVVARCGKTATIIADGSIHPNTFDFVMPPLFGGQPTCEECIASGGRIKVERAKETTTV